MINDRFASRLRQHLLDTANERPAAEQLPALDERVALTAQRSTLGARLTWFPKRLSLFPSATVRYGLIAVALVVATLAAALVAGTSPRPSPRPGETTFTSAIHGISIDHPAGWQARPATEAWTGEELSFDSPAADVIFDPAFGDRLYLLIASQPYGDLSEGAWRASIDWLCSGPSGTFRFDGARAWAVACAGGVTPEDSGGDNYALIYTDSRGYLIRLIAPTDERRRANPYDWDWLKPMLDTVDLRPEEALDDVSATP